MPRGGTGRTLSRISSGAGRLAAARIRGAGRRWRACLCESLCAPCLSSQLSAAWIPVATPPARPGCAWPRPADDMVRIGIADLRGDGRPDYAYNGWVLYADTVRARATACRRAVPSPSEGMGFRLSDTVMIGGQQATVTSISPNQITAIAPPAERASPGSVDVEVDDDTSFLRGRSDTQRHQLRLRHWRRSQARHRACQHRAHWRAAAVHRYGARLGSHPRRSASP